MPHAWRGFVPASGGIEETFLAFIQCHDGDGRKPDNPADNLKLLALANACRDGAREMFAIVAEEIVTGIGEGSVVACNRKRLVGDLTEYAPDSGVLKPIGSDAARILMNDDGFNSVGPRHPKSAADIGYTVMIAPPFQPTVA